MVPPDPQPASIGDRARHGLDITWALVVNSIQGLSEHRATQLAAGMAYYALLSVFPLAIVFVAASSLFLDDPDSRNEAISFLIRELPLQEDQGRQELERLIDGVIDNSGTIGFIGVLGLMFTASALLSAARNSVSAVYGDDLRRGFLRGKFVDVLMVLALGLLFSVSFGATLLIQLDVELSGTVGSAIESVLDATGTFLPLIPAAIVFTVLYRVLPVQRPAFTDVWPGVLVATLGYELVKRGFSIYLQSFADYDAVYGSLGAVVAFMFFVYLVSLVFLFGAEFASHWPAARSGKLVGDDDGRGTGEKVKDWFVGLFRSGRER